MPTGRTQQSRRVESQVRVGWLTVGKLYASTVNERLREARANASDGRVLPKDIGVAAPVSVSTEPADEADAQGQLNVSPWNVHRRGKDQLADDTPFPARQSGSLTRPHST